MVSLRPGPLPVCLLSASLLLGLAACNDRKCMPNSPCPTPTPPPGAACRSIAGTHNMFWSDTCGRRGQGDIVIAQAGCNVSASIDALGTLTGTVSGTTLTFTLTFSDPCTGTASGTAPISASPIVASYDGSETGGQVCCGQVSGTVTFDNSAPAPTPTPTPAR